MNDSLIKGLATAGFLGGCVVGSIFAAGEGTAGLSTVFICGAIGAAAVPLGVGLIVLAVMGAAALFHFCTSSTHIALYDISGTTISTNFIRIFLLFF